MPDAVGAADRGESQPVQTSRLAAAIERHGNLAELPPSAAKEVEFQVNGLNAVFEPVPDLAGPP